MVRLENRVSEGVRMVDVLVEEAEEDIEAEVGVGSEKVGHLSVFAEGIHLAGADCIGLADDRSFEAAVDRNCWHLAGCMHSEVADRSHLMVAELGELAASCQLSA